MRTPISFSGSSKIRAGCVVGRWLGVAMILPTLIVACDIAYKSRGNRAELAHNLAVCFWIAANATWMTGEFFFEDMWRPYARFFFVLGAVALAWHYLPLLAGRKNSRV
jgi:hypothetical protein